MKYLPMDVKQTTKSNNQSINRDLNCSKYDIKYLEFNTENIWGNNNKDEHITKTNK